MDMQTKEMPEQTLKTAGGECVEIGAVLRDRKRPEISPVLGPKSFDWMDSAGHFTQYEF